MHGTRSRALCSAIVATSALLVGGCPDDPSRQPGGGTSGTAGTGGHAGAGGGTPFGAPTDTTAEYITPDAACGTHEVACLLPCPTGDLYVAINPWDYRNSEACGACMEVIGPNGSVTVQVIENCAEACAEGEIELSETAFAQIADVSEGHAEVTWQLVRCQLDGPIAFHFEPESTEWWASIQVRNHVLPVTQLEMRWSDGSWRLLERRPHNYAETDEAPGPGPYALRVTAIDGQRLVEEGIPLSPGQLVVGQGQFD